MKPSFHEWATDRRLKGLVLLVLALAALALLSYTYLSIRQAKYADNAYGPTTISVRGEGEVVVVPDIAMFSFGVHIDDADSMTAQKRAAEATNAIIAYLKENGVAEADIKTLNYNLSPRYKTEPEPPYMPYDTPVMEEIMPIAYDYGIGEIIGYTVYQSVQVKVRDTARAGELIAGVGKYEATSAGHGATDISGLEFTIDDDTNVKAEARAKAIANAKEKARQLADTLGVRLVRLTGFWEEEGGYYPMYEKGYGGDMMSEPRVISPDVPMGENTITSRVDLTYEIR